MTRTLAVSLENRPGAFAEIARILGSSGVDILGFSTQALGDFGQVHFHVDDVDKGSVALQEAGIRFRTREVIVTRVPEKQGILGTLAGNLADAGVNIEIAFLSVGSPGGHADIVLEVDDFAGARKALKDVGFEVLDD